MRIKWVAGAILTIVAAAVIGLMLGKEIPNTPRSNSPISLDKLSQTIARNSQSTGVEAAGIDAAQTRSERFAKLSKLDDIMQLQSEFDQTDALYALAGRASSKELAELMKQALSISDESDRSAALGILFSRLTDLSPETAVELAGQHPFNNVRNIESSIWRSWSRRNLEQALAAASELYPSARKYKAAQDMYFAFGLHSNPNTERIEQVLGIAPSQWIKSLYTLSLAKRSLIEAISFLNTVRPAKDQRYIAGKLGEFVGKLEGNSAESLASAISALASRERFLSAAQMVAASTNPSAVLDDWLSKDALNIVNSHISTAFAELAIVDHEAALSYWAKIDNNETKLAFSSVIVENWGASDPIAAFQWARDAQAQGLHGALGLAVRSLAKLDPSKTLDMVYANASSAEIKTLIAPIIGALAESDPQLAAQKVREMRDASERKAANTLLIREWVNIDTQASLHYAMEILAEVEPSALNLLSGAIKMIEPDLAMKFIDSIEGWAVNQWTNALAANLVKLKPAHDIDAFLDQHAGSKAHTNLQSSLVSLLIRKQPSQALSIAASMSDGPDKDRAYLGLVYASSDKEPWKASELVNSISDPQSRKSAITELAYRWIEKDANEAQRWAEQLENSDDRDRAIRAVAAANQTLGGADIRLIQTISDEKMRQEALSFEVLALAAKDRASAEALALTVGFDEQSLAAINKQIETCYAESGTKTLRRNNCRRHSTFH